MRLVAAAAVAVALLVPLTACGGNPPQIVDYSPQRGAIDVSTAAPIHIAFDHAVDQASVESRLHLNPETAGSVHWSSNRQLVYEHATLQTSATYEVILEAGYRDLIGNTYTLRHHWSFVTERPPALAGSTPTDGDTGIDPAAYLSVDFSREMDATSLGSALTFNPNVPFNVRLDPGDRRRAIIAPSQLLTPNTHYQLAINTAALDVDGNQLDRDQTVDFVTGPARPLQHWVTFTAAGADGSPAGLWMVNESGFPRPLFDTNPVHDFSWSPDGDSVLLQGDAETWSELVPGEEPLQLNFRGPWAAALAAGLGYVYIDDAGVLHRLSADGIDDVIASDVAQAVVAPSGLRVAFVMGASGPDEVWGYDVGIRARYELALDTAPVSDVMWSPAGNRIAYLRSEAGSISLRVRSLTGAATTTTIASGDLGAPSWLPDSTHLVFAAATKTPTGIVHKAFVVNVVAPPAALNPAQGLPSDPNVDLASPVPSPDGHQIAFLNGGQVWLMNADGTRPTALTRLDPESFPYSSRAPAWTRA
ncbi:MAG: Ig-like domain-containing protein [Candidatus Dormiibacterota bacterium]